MTSNTNTVWSDFHARLGRYIGARVGDRPDTLRPTEDIEREMERTLAY